MIRIVVKSEVANQIRCAEGQIELVDEQGNRVGVVRRPPTADEIEYAKLRMGSRGPKVTIEELMAKVEAV